MSNSKQEQPLRRFKLGGQTFVDDISVFTLTSGEIKFEVDALKSVKLTYKTEQTGIDVLYTYAMVLGGKAKFTLYEDAFPGFWMDWVGGDGRTRDYDKSSLFTTVEPKGEQNLDIATGADGTMVVQTIMGYFDQPEKTVRLSSIYDVMGIETAVPDDCLVSKEMLRDTAGAFLGLSARIAHHEATTRLDYWENSNMRKTIVNVVNQACSPLLTMMVRLAHASGLFDRMQQGSRWLTDHAFYNLWARNSLRGTTEVGKFSFFLVGVLGYQFTAFGSLCGLSVKLSMSITEILCRIALPQSLKMLQAITVRKSLLSDTDYPWFLLCHSLAGSFQHEFSVTQYPVISYISLYATELLAGVTNPEINIGGLNKFSDVEKATMAKIARELIGVRSADMFTRLEAEVDDNPLVVPKKINIAHHGGGTEATTPPYIGRVEVGELDNDDNLSHGTEEELEPDSS